MAEICVPLTELPDYVAQECGGESGGIVAVAFLDSSVELSAVQIITDAAWTALTDAVPSLAWLIKETRGEYPKPSVEEGEGFGRIKTITTGRNHEVTIEALGIKDNRNFFDNLNQRSTLKFAFVTHGGLLHYVNQGVSIDAGMQIDRDINSWEFFPVTVRWSNKRLPLVYDEPPTVFK